MKAGITPKRLREILEYLDLYDRDTERHPLNMYEERVRDWCRELVREVNRLRRIKRGAS